ncbi:MFS transporter [Microbacterium sp. B35-30]|uniref:MFS transporter n=1 Tax=Microbacterium sp. B35-30 TaxID=1962642 RepID=UPI0013D870C8|nr:MFS transporter [Microbacterium sp. B35-30]KAF2420873.1 hypothetical protein B2K11_00620 [Microbacterium sp. B35-30]
MSASPVRRLWLSVFLAYLAFGGTLQLLPMSLESRFQSDAAFIGLAVGTAFAATAACRPFAGWAGDAGAGRPVVVLGGVLTLAGVLGQALAVDEWHVLVARVVMGSGEAAVFSAALPWVLRGVPADRRSSTAGLFGMSMWSGLSLGPLLMGGVVLGGETAAWLTLATLGLASALAAVATPTSGPVAPPPFQARSFWPRGVGSSAVIFGLAAYGYGTITAVLVLHLAHGAGGAEFGLPVFAGAFLLVRITASRAVDRFGGPTVAVATLTAESAGFVLILTTDAAAAALVGVALVGAGCSLAFPAVVGITLSRPTGRTSGGVIAGVTSFWDLGALAAAVCAGILATEFDTRAAFAAAVTATILALVIAVWTSRQGRRAVTQRDARTSSAHRALGPGRSSRPRET